MARYGKEGFQDIAIALIFFPIIRTVEIATSKAERNKLKYGKPSEFIGELFIDKENWKISSCNTDNATKWEISLVPKKNSLKQVFYLTITYLADNINVDVTFHAGGTNEMKSVRCSYNRDEIHQFIKTVMNNFPLSHKDYLSLKDTSANRWYRP